MTIIFHQEGWTFCLPWQFWLHGARGERVRAEKSSKRLISSFKGRGDDGEGSCLGVALKKAHTDNGAGFFLWRRMSNFFVRSSWAWHQCPPVHFHPQFLPPLERQQSHLSFSFEAPPFSAFSWCRIRNYNSDKKRREVTWTLGKSRAILGDMIINIFVASPWHQRRSDKVPDFFHS